MSGFWARCWRDFGQILVRCWPAVGGILASLWSDVDSSTGTEKYSFTVPPDRRKATGKPCIEHPILKIQFRIVWKNNPDVGLDFLGFFILSVRCWWFVGDFGGHIWRMFGDISDVFSCSFALFWWVAMFFFAFVLFFLHFLRSPFVVDQRVFCLHWLVCVCN